ncbi:hypothetical protein HPB52_020913 [Rhipicephalus sanguineus]|uniref:Uncharacterized protein n=1 Tax=Rhipicephalus sanguineus TaxID=34632 RepID=A0A9D4SXU4_RHISA|nr:hypothetical protein HPB52_020913 [Rhipicephalus sanguineus]
MSQVIEGEKSDHFTGVLDPFALHVCLTDGVVRKKLAATSQVARTRLRQEGDKYRSFFQTLFLVWREEGYQGLYRGLATQLVRQIPNTAIMMATYEAVVYMLSPAVYGASPANDD